MIAKVYDDPDTIVNFGNLGDLVFTIERQVNSTTKAQIALFEPFDDDDQINRIAFRLIEHDAANDKFTQWESVVSDKGYFPDFTFAEARRVLIRTVGSMRRSVSLNNFLQHIDADRALNDPDEEDESDEDDL